MDEMQLRELIFNSISVDTSFINPGGGSSIVMSINQERIVYKRGNSKISYKILDVLESYEYYKGEICSASDLKEFKPSVYDSTLGGHSCNCTFLFLLLDEIGLVENGIRGRGVRGDPFYVRII